MCLNCGLFQEAEARAGMDLGELLIVGPWPWPWPQATGWLGGGNAHGWSFFVCPVLDGALGMVTEATLATFWVAHLEG